ncbi:TPA: ABC transporter permease [Candidatus Poribacteria bacterium]|nr:ABC transporter permease [Candidatus Poribacteria bacterium]HIB87485.1 ABC transporter permease [Candidatus Poribacteria bacterium]HIC18175.1 ABC transporter permease [Candidatus Poribacteria bacterium]
MKNVLTIATKEIYTYFVSPIAYFVLVIFGGLSGFFFYAILQRAIVRQELSTAVIQVLFRNYVSVILLFFAPAVTMRLFAEETRSGTIELLRTSPVKDIEIVLGKFCASFVLYLTMLATTLVYPFLILPFGKVDIGQIISAYTGMVLLGATFLSFGLMISSMTRNQIVSALTSFGILLVFWIIGSFADRAGSLSRFFKYLSLIEHLNDFTRGVIVVKDVVYYLSFTFICVFFTIKSVESAKWK